MKKQCLLSFAICLIAFTCKAQNAMNFDGIDDFAVYPAASTELIAAPGYSISLWMKPTFSVPGFPEFGGAVGFRNETDADFYLLQLSGSSIEARFRGNNFQAYDIVYNGLLLNEWQHFVLTYNGTDLILYHQGAEAGFNAAFGSIMNGYSNFYIGKVPYGIDDFEFRGDIDEVSLWRTALSAEEVKAIYTCGIVGTENGLVAHYKFDEGIAGGDNTSIQFLEAEIGQDAALMNMELIGDTSNYVSGAAAPNQETINQDLIVDGNTLTAVEVADTYQWYSCETDYLILPGENGMSLNISESGTYIVFMELGGCSGFSDCVNVTISGLAAYELSSLSIFPNPAIISDGFWVASDKKWEQLSIIGISGMTFRPITKYQSKLFIRTNEWNAGLYFIKVEWPDGNRTATRIVLL